MCNKAKLLLLGLTLFSTSSCSDYWWSRGQAPSPTALYHKSESKLQKSIEDNSQRRAEIANLSKDLKSSLSAVIEQGSDSHGSNIKRSRELFSNLEGAISYGSRPAFAELAGQLRVIEANAKSNQFSKEAFLLYSSRVFDFLSNELSVDYSV